MSELQKVTEFEALLQRAEAAEAALAKSEESRQKLFSALQELKMQEPIGIAYFKESVPLLNRYVFETPITLSYETPIYAAPVEKVCRWGIRHVEDENQLWASCNDMLWPPHCDWFNACPNCGGKIKVEAIWR